jgi:hypothetical protein
VRLTTSPSSRAECHEIWESKPRGSLWATPGLLRDCFTFVQDLRLYVGIEVHLQSFEGSTQEGNERSFRVTTDLSHEELPFGSYWLRGTAGPDDLKKRKIPCHCNVPPKIHFSCLFVKKYSIREIHSRPQGRITATRYLK